MKLIYLSEKHKRQKATHSKFYLLAFFQFDFLIVQTGSNLIFFITYTGFKKDKQGDQFLQFHCCEAFHSWLRNALQLKI